MVRRAQIEPNGMVSIQRVTRSKQNPGSHHLRCSRIPGTAFAVEATRERVLR
jgi:hypothetical protein